MRASVAEKFRGSLSEKHGQLQEWIRTATPDQKAMHLGQSTEAGVQSHLQTIEHSIEEVELGTLGTCGVCHESVEIDRLEVDYTCCVCLDHFSPEEIRDLERELELAQTVQRTLLPRAIPAIPGLDIAAYSRPAQILGGDYFDFAEFEDGKHCLAIADVAGHGISASLHMASVQTMLQSIVASSSSPAEVVSQIHRLFIHNINFTTFVTLFIVAFEPGSNKMTYCSAGHNPAILVHSDMNISEPYSLLAPTGPAIGLIEEAVFADEHIDLRSGDLLLMYTDGLVEATNHHMEMYGMRRLQRVALSHRLMSAGDAIREIRKSVQGFVEDMPLLDDTTLLAARVLE